MTHSSTPVPVLDIDLIDSLRADLGASEWTVDRINTALSATATDAMMRGMRVPALLELAGSRDPAAVLTRFFMLGADEASDVLDAALPSLGARGLVRLGLAGPAGEEGAPRASAPSPTGGSGADGGAPGADGKDRAAAGTAEGAPGRAGDAAADGAGARPADEAPGGAEEGAPPRLAALFDLRPHSASLPDPDDPGAQREHQWWVASDLGEDVTGRPLDEDHVLGIGGASLSLLGQTIRERVGSALDLGCGCGIQALYLATHCGRVVATDLSARAGALTQFNAALNGAPIDVRVGSLFEPVSGESFDLIVSNPPFVITPDTVRAGAGFHEYRDGGMQRDELVGALIRSAPDHLAPGGTLQILANWEIPAGADPDGHWSPRVEDWLSGLGVDAWVVQRDALDPAQYAEMWIRDSGGHRMSHEAFERGYAAWLRDFTAAGVGAIGMGFLAVRRPEPGEGERAPGGPDQGAGGGQWLPGGGRAAFDLALEGRAPRGVDVAWALRSLRAPRTWDLVLTRAPDVREERHYVPGSPDPCLLVLHQGAGLGRSVPVSPAVSAVVGASDGALTVGQIVAAVAALTDREADDVWEEARAPLAELIRWGFLTF